MQKHLKSNSNRLLEFGAGIYALMAKECMEQNWNVTIQEPSIDFLSLLKEKFPHAKIETCDFLDIKEGRYSLIYADSVMEHVHDPLDYMNKVSSLLDHGGVFYFISPQENSFYNFAASIIKRLMYRTVTYLSPYKNPYHLIGFSRKGVEVMANKSGMSLVKHIRGYDYSFSKTMEAHSIFYLPLAVSLWIADKLGYGTNQEFILRKD